MVPVHHLRVDLGLLAGALVEAPRSALIVMISARIESESRATAVLDDAYTWLEDGVMDLSEGTRPWITEDIPAGRIR